MNIVRFTDHSSAAAGSKSERCAFYGSASNELKTLITRGDIGNSDRRPKCGNC